MSDNAAVTFSHLIGELIGFLVRALQLTQRAPDQTIVQWTVWVQELLVLALDPRANTGRPV